MPELTDSIITALEQNQPVALITSVRTVGSTPRHNAARLAVFPHGETAGSIGGGTMELQAVADARDALGEHKPRLVEYNLNGRGEGNLGLCGGTQGVFIDLLEPPSEAATQWRAIRAALAGGEPAVLAVILRAEGTDLTPGTRQVIRWSGDVLGSLGDRRMEQAVAEQARRVMVEHYPQRLGFDPVTGAVRRLVSTRQAAVEIFLDLYEPRPRLVIIGAGHIGVALARQAKFLGWHVAMVDDRPDYITGEHLPDADGRCLVAYDATREELGPLKVEITPGTAVAVATWGWDLPALRRLAGTPAFYTGLVASRRKAAVIFQLLREEGIDATWLDGVRVPIGLDVGAESPEEIALAIMAEILATARGKSGRPLCELHREQAASLMAATAGVPAGAS